MKDYLVLKDFNGSQSGLDFHRFTAGTTAKLSTSLATAALAEGWVKPHDGKAEPTHTPAPTPEPTPEPEVVPAETPEEARETKVSGPEETKPAKPADKKAGGKKK